MVVLVAVMAASTCFAQMGGTPEERLKRELDGLTAALNLTPAQVAKVTPIVTDAQKARSEMFQKMRDSGGQNRAGQLNPVIIPRRSDERGNVESEVSRSRLDSKASSRISRQRQVLESSREAESRS